MWRQASSGISLAENGGKSKPEERVFDAVEGALDEILADPELASLHNWVRSLWAKQEASEQAAQARNQAVLASGAP